jgi:SAM-dependent methyltransferase
VSINYIEKNKKLWNDRTTIHFDSEFYNVDAFLKGASSLNPIEIELLGNIKDKSILHLQCHFGMDTISLSRLGANTVGVDFSDKAIQKAKELAAAVKSDAKFIQSDVYKLQDKLNSEFDIVFTSYGAIGWLPDMDKWAGIVSRFLKSGGIFVLVEFHPVLWMFSDDFSKIEYDYFNTGAIIEEIKGTYTDRNAPICNESVSWNHPLREVFGALIKNGLTIEIFEEHDYSPYNCFDKVVEVEKNKYQIPGLEKKIPMLYSIRARK